MTRSLLDFQARELAIPETTDLAIQTRSAQLQDKVEQQQLKKLVLDYEKREGVEEQKGEMAQSHICQPGA